MEWKDRFVTLAADDQTNPSLAEPAHDTSYTYTIVLWEDERAGNKDIYAQKIDNATGVALWDPDGIPVCTAEYDQLNPSAAFDSLGGVIITWEDCRGDAQNVLSGVYAMRLLVSTGQPSPTWPLDGIIVCDQGMPCLRPHIAGTANGAFIVWTDVRISLARNAFIQYVMSDGTQSWAANGRVVSTSTDNGQLNPEVARDNIWRYDTVDGTDKCGVVVAYQDNRRIGSSNGNACWNIFLDRFLFDGSREYGDVCATPTAVQNGVCEDQSSLQLRCMGRERTAPTASALVCWQDRREDPTNGITDIYGQIVDEFGDMDPNVLDGIPFCSSSAKQQYPVMTIWERPEIPGCQTYLPIAILAWEDFRSSYYGDVYGAQYDVTWGNYGVLSPCSVNGDPVATIPLGKSQLSIDNVPDAVVSPTNSTAYIAWRQETISTPDIWNQSVRVPSWAQGYPLYGMAVTEAKGEQCLPQISGDVFIYQDARRDPIVYDTQDDWNICCQTPGECVGPKEMDWREIFVKRPYASNAAHMQSVTNPNDFSTFIVWDEIRDSIQSVFIQKLDKDGVPRWRNDGIRLNGDSTALKPSVAIDDAGGAQVVWQQEYTPGIYRIRYSQIMSDGVVGPLTSHLLPVGGVGQDLSDTDPIIVDNHGVASPLSPAIVAFLETNAILTYTQRCISLPTIPPRANVVGPGSAVVHHSDLRMDRDFTGGCYLVTHGSDGAIPPNHIINVAYGTWNGSSWRTLDNENIALSSASFHGYDMCADIFPFMPNSQHELMLAYSDIDPASGSEEIFVQRYAPQWGGWLGIPAGWSVGINATAAGDYTKPAITPDSIPYSTGGGSPNTYGGMLLACDRAYQPTVQIVHEVWSRDISWDPTGPIMLSPPFPVSTQSLVDTTYPDIARLINRGINIGYLHGIIVWEGGGEQPYCSPPRPKEIMSQYTYYYGISANILWFPEQMVDPGPGYYMQTKPTVHTSQSHSASVVWLDNRAGNTGIAETRFADLVGIIWLKVADTIRSFTADPAIFSVSPSWPNPMSLASGSRINCSVTLPAGGSVDMRIVDALGRTLLHHTHKNVSGGQRMLSVTLPNETTPGIHFIQISTDNCMIARPFQVIR